MNDYERVASVIRLLDTHYVEQPDLAALARGAGLSPFHLHRLFSAWAGVTPKDFLQCLTLAHAKKALREGQSVLDTALASGLSGPGRLHDLCVTLEAASPGEIKSGGAGCTLEAGFAASPFGTCLAARSDRGVCHLSFVEDGREKADWAALCAAWPNARLHRDDGVARGVVAQVFEERGSSRRGSTALRAFVRGTAFQLRVWRALLQVPPGSLITYGQLAAAIGRPTAARAVGTAVGQNPLAYLIPCHRVIRSTGLLGDYRWGQVRKQAINAWERAGLLTDHNRADRRESALVSLEAARAGEK